MLDQTPSRQILTAGEAIFGGIKVDSPLLAMNDICVWCAVIGERVFNTLFQGGKG